MSDALHLQIERYKTYTKEGSHGCWGTGRAVAGHSGIGTVGGAGGKNGGAGVSCRVGGGPRGTGGRGEGVDGGRGGGELRTACSVTSKFQPLPDANK
jgi:hypothetical protein